MLILGTFFMAHIDHFCSTFCMSDSCMLLALTTQETQCVHSGVASIECSSEL